MSQDVSDKDLKGNQSIQDESRTIQGPIPVLAIEKTRSLETSTNSDIPAWYFVHVLILLFL